MQPNLIWRERSSSGGAGERRGDVGHGHRPSRISAVPVTALRMVCSLSRGRQTTLRSSSTLQDKLSNNNANRIGLDSRAEPLGVLENRYENNHHERLISKKQITQSYYTTRKMKTRKAIGK